MQGKMLAGEREWGGEETKSFQKKKFTRAASNLVLFVISACMDPKRGFSFVCVPTVLAEVSHRHVL